MKTFLQHVVFRNYFFKEPVVQWMTAANGKTPEGIAASIDVTFENCIDDQYKIVDFYCGDPCNEAYNVSNEETQASRDMALNDYDGSLSQLYKATIIGARRDWWKLNDDCIYDDLLFLHYCPWYSKANNDTWNYSPNYHEIGFVSLHIPGLTAYVESPNITGMDQHISFSKG